jgi:glutathione S-transferase
LTLYAHPFSAYSWKALIALYENATPFRYRKLDEPGAMAELETLWPLRKFPVLRDGDAVLIETSVIIEHLAWHHPGSSVLLPRDPEAAAGVPPAAAASLEVRFLDRFFDNYVMTPTQKVVADRLRPDGERDARGVREARSLLEAAFGWLERRLAPEHWAAGGNFTLADCAAAPALFYADWIHPIAEQYALVRGYRRRLLARPSVARVVEEARPYRGLFPGGAPDQD